MAGEFSLKKFSEIDLNDSFFDSLKADYPGNGASPSFADWFPAKAKEGRTALVFDDDQGIGAFICIKPEDEAITLTNGTLPKKMRCKISTMKIAERFRGQRIGEGAIGLTLWKWQQLGYDDIYVTVFDKQDLLITLLTKFGFIKIGNNLNGEGVYMKSRSNVDYSDPFRSFPFINPDFNNSGYIIIDDYYHDTMFPYSELKNTLQTKVALSVSNGLSKIYVGQQYSAPPYGPGDPILIYRRHTGPTGKKYKSCLTSFCILTKVIQAKENGIPKMPFDELLKEIGNKSVFDQGELQNRYNNDRNMMVYEMLYYGYFGSGNNVNMAWLDNNGYWCGAHNVSYPALIRLSPNEFKEILQEGNVDVSNVIID
ncbi:MAG: hypothetical protein HUJ72_10595 [Blautia sp.]|nr:hypothetical protein [Blautia sp.]